MSVATQNSSLLRVLCALYFSEAHPKKPLSELHLNVGDARLSSSYFRSFVHDGSRRQKGKNRQSEPMSSVFKNTQTASYFIPCLQIPIIRTSALPCKNRELEWFSNSRQAAQIWHEITWKWHQLLEREPDHSQLHQCRTGQKSASTDCYASHFSNPICNCCFS